MTKKTGAIQQQPSSTFTALKPQSGIMSNVFERLLLISEMTAGMLMSACLIVLRLITRMNLKQLFLHLSIGLSHT